MKKTKTVLRDEEGIISEPLKDQFLLFIEQHAKRFSRNLRRVLMDFLMFDGAIEARYLNDLLYDLDGFFELLEVIDHAKSKSESL